MDNKAQIGFDSCSAPKFSKAVEDHPNNKSLIEQAEPCEATLFSSYINHNGYLSPCSFIEGIPGWEEGIDVTGDASFEEIWNNDKVNKFRKELNSCGRNCPKFTV